MKFASKEIRRHIISFRLTAAEAGKLDLHAKKSSVPLSTSEACRAVCLRYIDKLPPAPPKKKIKARRKPHIDTESIARSLGLIGQIYNEISEFKENADKHNALPSIGVLGHIQQNLADIKADLSKALMGGANGY